MTKVLVTGAGGFVGKHLVAKLGKKGYTVSQSVYSPTTDLTDFAYTESLIQETKPDVVYQLAALSVVEGSERNAPQILTANSVLQYNILEAVRLHAPGARIVAICSANGYGLVAAVDTPIKETCPQRPLNPYAVSKVTQELLAQEYYLAYNMDIVILRPFNHTGPGQTPNFVIPALAKQFVSAERGEISEIVVGNTATIRDFTDVEDMVDAYILAGEKCKSGEVYNIGSGHGVSIHDVIELFRKVTKIDIPIRIDVGNQRTADVPILVADNSKFVAATGWAPTIPLDKTIINVLDFWRKQ